MSEAGLIYTREAEAERQFALQQSLAADEQEARSLRYVCGLRLALLSSGRWAIWSGGTFGEGPGELILANFLDEPWLRRLEEENRRRLEEELEARGRGAEVSQAQGSVEEMGL